MLLNPAFLCITNISIVWNPDSCQLSVSSADAGFKINTSDVSLVSSNLMWHYGLVVEWCVFLGLGFFLCLSNCVF